MDNVEYPLVSIITPCYNHEKFLRGFIESIYNQTYKKFEFSIIDDGSTDGSLKVIKELSERYGFEYETQLNHGICYTLNKLIKKTRGKYIIAIASDDVLFKDRLEKQVKFMENHPEYGMCHSKDIVINERGEKIRVKYVDPNIQLNGWIFEQLLEM